jgi:hypothetical protein
LRVTELTSGQEAGARLDSNLDRLGLDTAVIALRARCDMS